MQRVVRFRLENFNDLVKQKMERTLDVMQNTDFDGSHGINEAGFKALFVNSLRQSVAEFYRNERIRFIECEKRIGSCYADVYLVLEDVDSYQPVLGVLYELKYVKATFSALGVKYYSKKTPDDLRLSNDKMAPSKKRACLDIIISNYDNCTFKEFCENTFKVPSGRDKSGSTLFEDATKQLKEKYVDEMQPIRVITRYEKHRKSIKDPLNIEVKEKFLEKEGKRKVDVSFPVIGFVSMGFGRNVYFSDIVWGGYGEEEEEEDILAKQLSEKLVFTNK